ncbi:MAG: MFS transporter [Chitinophagia bacterium]|nr:MFS transporter [Chitinophagia bacterium]
MSQKRNAALGFILVTILIDVIGVGIIIPVIPTLIKELTGSNITVAAKYGSWLLFTYAIMQFLFSPLVGGLSDRFGRRPVLLFSLFGLGVDYIFQAFSPTITLLFIGRIIAGITGASFTTATAYIADISPLEKRAQNFGMVGAAFGIGFVIGPAIGGLCNEWGGHLPYYFGVNWSIRLPFIIAAGFSFLNLLYGFFVLPESLAKENRRKFEWQRANPISSLLRLKKYPVVSGLVVSLFLLYLASHAVQSNWSYYTIYKFQWTPLTVGLSLTMVGLCAGLVQGVLIRYTLPRLGEKKSVVIGFSLYAVAMLLFAFAWQAWMMFVFLIPYCMGGIGGPALQGIMSSEVPANEQGELQGAMTGVMCVTSFVGPLLMNNVFAYFTNPKSLLLFPGMPFILGAAMIITAIICALPSLNHYQSAKAQRAAMQPELFPEHETTA